MKKKTILILLISLYSLGIKAQSSCTSAQSLLTYTNGGTLSQTSQEGWYYFNADHESIFLDVWKKDTTFILVDSIFVYGSNCSSPILIASCGRPYDSDSIPALSLVVKGLALTSTYYIKIKLKTSPTFTINYAINKSDATTGTCDFVVNGDFETVGLYNCSVYTISACALGFPLVPGWASGGWGAGLVYSSTCGTVTYWPAAHSGNNMGLISTGSKGLSGSPVDEDSYLRTTLPNSLIATKKYYVQMFYKSWSASNALYTDGLAIYLSAGTPTMSYISTYSLMCANLISPTLTPQFQNPPGILISNTQWLPMGGVYTASGGEDHITIGNFKPSALLTFSTSPLAGLSQKFIDDVSVTPVDFTITPVSICSGMVTQLAPDACTPPYCTSTYTWLPATGLSNVSILNPMVNPSVTTTYTLLHQFTNALGAVTSSSAQVTVTVTPATFTFSAAANPPVICTNLSQSTSTLTATGSNTITFLWQPGTSYGALKTVSPSVTSIYTIIASVGNCVLTQTVTVVISTVCCTSTVTAMSSPFVNGVDINGPMVINQDLTVTGNAISRFQNGEFLIAPNVKITIQGGSQLELNGAHLYGCSGSMWQGIDVLPYAGVLAKPSTTTGNCTLIEDAVTAVNVSNYSVTPSLYAVEMIGSIFNKNYVSININSATTNSVPISLLSMIFTCRTFTFNQIQWPNTTTTTPDLRAATNPTTGLDSPYGLQGASYTNLKSPYSSQPSLVGIYLTDAGNPSGLPSFSISVGRQAPGASDDFNLFDGLGIGIYAINSNVHSSNNVFQNMRHFTAASLSGAGIYMGCNSTMNTELKLTEPNGNNSLSTGNRFWNCYRGIDATNLYHLDAQYAIFRSVQTYTAVGYYPGNTGIYINSSRFNYNIANSIFNNINYCINISFYAGTFNTSGTVQNGIFANNLSITGNYFGPQPSSSVTAGYSYINNAINVSSPNSVSWVSQSNTGVKIKSNNINRAFHGISLSGMNNYLTNISTNSITIADDIMAGTTQHGIELMIVMNNNVVLTNTLSGTGITNTLSALIYGNSNTGMGSPSICCNNLDNSYKGFEFNGNNIGTVWKGNRMDTHARGMMLSANGQIGQQGSSGNPSDNQWYNFGANNGTWTDASSDAQYSKLVLNSIGGVYTPPNNNGAIAGQSYALSGNLIGTTGTYVCAATGTMPPVYMTVPGGDPSVVSSEMLYAADDVLYRYLSQNDSIRGSDPALTGFYGGLTGSSHDLFQQAEAQFYAGLVSDGLSLSSVVTTTNTVESNFQSYYRLYAVYATDSLFSGSDSSALYGLAALCPGSNGSCIYQARALYNLAYKTILNFSESCDDYSGARKAAGQPGVAADNKSWGITLFPNPAVNILMLRSSNEKESLQVSVKDLSGRMVLAGNVICNNFMSTLGLNLANGVYLVSISNSNHESITKKLVIAK